MAGRERSDSVNSIGSIGSVAEVKKRGRGEGEIEGFRKSTKITREGGAKENKEELREWRKAFEEMMMDWVEKLKLLVDNKLESFSKQGREVKEEIERLREGLREQKRSEGWRERAYWKP